MSDPNANFPTQYDPKAHEDATYQKWEQSGVFASKPDKDKKPFTIMMPPPNATGVLHVGHAPYSLQDLLTRFNRMRGFEALWQPGTDHAGIATQIVVEKLIARRENKTRYQVGREELVKRVWEYTRESGGTIFKQLRKLGASCDWSRARFTLDEGLSRAVREAFVRLHEGGLLYRGKYLVNWCPSCRTTLSDDEVEREEVNGRLFELHYPLADDPSQRLTVATTRPETMLGDTAVAVNPADERHKHLIGKKVKLPLANREIPVVADNAVEFGFGTGCLKVTPAHDPVDYQIGLRHKLPLLNILTEDGRLNENCPAEFRGMDKYHGRKAILKAMEALGLVGDIKDHRQQVGHCYRCDTAVEPYLTSQWFVNMKPLSALAVKATESGRVKFHPERWTKVYLAWFKDVRDWPISRQIWWGHQIPAWYCLEDNGAAIQKLEAGTDQPFDVEEGGRRYRYLIGENAKPIVSREDPATLPEYKNKTLIRDPDVLDTWFSSALWPFSTLGWPEKTPDLDYYYPTDVLLTDRGIIYFWVARMVMMGEFLMGAEPFKHVVIHGTILDGEGAKMSKSRGNGIDPLDIINRYGADALRFTIFDMATEGQDLKFPVQIICPHCDTAQELPSKRNNAIMKCVKCKQDFQQPVPNEPPLPEPKLGALDSKRFEKGRNFTNKIWNAARFVLTSIKPGEVAKLDAKAIEASLRDEDRWILSRLNRTIAEVEGALTNFEFSKSTNALYQFFWDDFCAWTIELSKPRLAGAEAGVAGAVLLHVLDRSLRLLHPFCPYITEALWTELAKVAPQTASRNLGETPQNGARAFAAETLAGSAWMPADNARLNEKLEAEFATLFDAIRAVRNIRQKNGIAPKERLKVSVKTAPETAQQLASRQHILEQMANITTVKIGPDAVKPKPAGTEVIGGTEVYVDLAGLIDPVKERERLSKELERAQNAVNQSEKKLGDDKFMKGAPPDKIEGEKARLDEYKTKVASLQSALKELE